MEAQRSLVTLMLEQERLRQERLISELESSKTFCAKLSALADPAATAGPAKKDTSMLIIGKTARISLFLDVRNKMVAEFISRLNEKERCDFQVRTV